MERPKPTPVPRTPALVRRGAAAVAVGLLSASACGGEILRSGRLDGSLDDAVEGDSEVPPAPAPVAFLDAGEDRNSGIPLPPPAPAPFDAGGDGDAAIRLPLPPPPPLPK